MHGFKYFDDRDLLGFVDGTENPTGAAAAAAVTVGDEDPTSPGSSYVIVQKYLHDLDAWNALTRRGPGAGHRPPQAVERRAARRREAQQLPRRAEHDRRGPTAPSARSCATTWRSGRSGAASSARTSSATRPRPSVTEQMLRNMFVGDPPGNHDRILDFSTAVTGILFFVPTAALLDESAPHARRGGRRPGGGDRQPPGPAGLIDRYSGRSPVARLVVPWSL